jgi:Na+-transporting methylmalonyl-CoA/oxaloacetate decarboxylase gamma subunit
MESLNEIATSGAPGAVTVIGMGTVFACLVLLYCTTRILGIWVPRLLAAAAPAAPEPVEPRSEAEGAEASAPAPDDAGIAAAATLVLARHRFRRGRPAAVEASSADSWKLDGRIRTLRDR